jgi:CheY-like chemotaxis protein
MNPELSPAQEFVNQSIEPILLRSLKRFRALLPPQVDLALDLSHDQPRVRAQSSHLEETLLSACIVAWQSMGTKTEQLIVEMREVLLDEVVLDPDAGKLGGGLPPRRYAWLTITNSSRMTAGPFHTLMPAPDQIDNRSVSTRRLKLHEMRSIIDHHQGWLSALPEPDKGTAFDIYLPTALPLERPMLSGSGSDLKHIMYVDDYDAMRDLVSETLPDAGFEVSCYDSPRAAMAAFMSNPHKWDALVSDYRLQGGSGIDLLRLIKPMRADLPMIILSGYVDEALRARGLEEGASLVMSKTSDLSELCVALRKLMGNVPTPALVNYSEWAKL